MQTQEQKERALQHARLKRMVRRLRHVGRRTSDRTGMSIFHDFLAQSDLKPADEQIVRLSFLEGWSRQRLGYPMRPSHRSAVAAAVFDEGIIQAGKGEQP